MASQASNLYRRLARRKYIPKDQVCNTQLKRCLTTLDLTALGIGSTLGLGIYVLSGKVAKELAGPSVMLSFLIAAIASVFAGLCYAEFGARVPRTGSAYVYSYVTVGEVIAFIIGWNLIMEYVIGTASVAKGYSGYLDFLLDNKMENALKNALPINIPFISAYPDFLAAGITLLLSVVLAFGVKESSFFNNIFTLLNLLVVLYVVICGSFKADIHNWQLTKEEVHQQEAKEKFKVNYGEGGFFPYGLSGMLAGAASCFYGFVGFDCIATTGEEVKNPQKAIPISIVLSLLFIFLAYFGISTVTTLMWPYFDQDPKAPLPHVFDAVGWPVAKWIVSIGALAGLSTSLLGAMFPLPRIIYAMSTDGLIFRFLSSIHPKLKTPFVATIIAGVITAFLALLLTIDELIEMMSIGTLMAYTLVAACVLLLRYCIIDYSNCEMCSYSPIPNDSDAAEYRVNESSDEETGDVSCSKSSLSPVISQDDVRNFKSVLIQYFNMRRHTVPSLLSSDIVSWNVRVLALVTIWLAANIIFLGTEILELKAWALFLLVLNILLLLVVFVSIALQPQNPEKLSFKVPWVPLVPWLSLFINIFLMLKLSYLTWIRFAVWLTLGLMIYVFYGMRESSEEYRQRGLQPPSNMPVKREEGTSEQPPYPPIQ